MPLEVLAAGELLVDFISIDQGETLGPMDRFQPFPGGSPANLASNLCRLGVKAGLAATVGQDDLGDYLVSYAKSLGLDTEQLRQTAKAPTTMILLSRSQGVPKFEAYRAADREISAEQLLTSRLSNLKLFHTTCFALSQEPARSAIMAAATVASVRGDVSIDTNYAQKIWPNQEEARTVVADYCSLGALVKCSDVDWERLYGEPLNDQKEAIAFFHELGAKLVCLTLGADGSMISNGEEIVQMPVRPIEVVDTTGAGDAFWSGFLAAYLKNESLVRCAEKARAMAELKLQCVGPLQLSVNYVDLL